MAASSSTPAHWYQIFINHRGVDVKKTFARALYLRLLQNGLKPFLDQDEMQLGYSIPAQINDAITTASVHVAILSPRYAESCWCLKELVLMLETKAPIIPVFYRVTPAEVKRTRGKDGNYARALRKLAKKKTHQKKWRFDSNTIENWRNALSSVADISGLELEVCNGEELEPELLDKLVEHLSKMVKMTKPDLHVADYPTGLDFKLKGMETLTSLKRFYAHGCVKLKSIPALEQCSKLTVLDVSTCSDLEELPSMETLASMEELYAYGCVKLKSIPALEHCTKLGVLSVWGCCELEEVEGVEHCNCIEELDMSRCPKLQCHVWE